MQQRMALEMRRRGERRGGRHARAGQLWKGEGEGGGEGKEGNQSGGKSNLHYFCSFFAVLIVPVLSDDITCEEWGGREGRQLESSGDRMHAGKEEKGSILRGHRHISGVSAIHATIRKSPRLLKLNSLSALALPLQTRALQKGDG